MARAVSIARRRSRRLLQHNLYLKSALHTVRRVRRSAGLSNACAKRTLVHICQMSNQVGRTPLAPAVRVGTGGFCPSSSPWYILCPGVGLVR
jgi:hypothetical protein